MADASSRFGFGCAASAGTYGAADHDEAVATIRAALDAGITLLDVGDFYGMGLGELTLGEAIGGRRREDVTLSVKFGAQRDPSGTWLGHDNSPAAIKTALAYSLTRLRTDYVDIYRPARPDPHIPIEEIVGTVAELVQAGYVRQIGLSEAGADTIRRAHGVHPIHDVQMEYSLISRRPEEAVLPVCNELGINVTAYGVLSRGLLSGHWTPDRARGGADLRTHLPRFQPGNVERNLALVERLRELARARDLTVAQLALAWVAARGDNIVPLVGARNREQLAEAAGALAVSLTWQDTVEIAAAVPADAAAGERYGAAQMAALDSERS